jgi:hypothetical protein
MTNLIGAPGYGKTVLSTKVIEYLQSRKKPNAQSGLVDPVITFFHFDKLAVENNEPHSALRGLLAQILHQLGDDSDLLDAASLLIQEAGSGQRFASEADIESMLSFALSRVENCIIVVDGVDECLNPNLFLRKLYTISRHAACKVLLFSRPDLIIPKPYKGSSHIRLNRTANLEDIRLFVQPRIDEMEDSGLIPSGLTARSLVDTIVLRSNSLFLWAKLMVAYLESPALTQRARYDAVNNMVSLEGLNAIYSKIVETIEGRMHVEREFVFKMFQWLVVATRPFHISELQAASAIRLNERTCPDLDYVKIFDTALVQLCGALV